MAYSRWSNSKWYTYWTTDVPLSNKRSGQYLCIMLPNDERWILPYPVVRAITKQPESMSALAAVDIGDDVHELLGYMKEFCRDVEQDRKLKP